MNHRLSLSLSVLCLASACGGRSAEYEQAKALQAQIQAATQAHGGDPALVPAAGQEPTADPAATQQAKGRSADAVDVMGLVTEAEVVAILKQRGAAGDATATGSFEVKKKKVGGNGTPGNGSAMCRYDWVARDADHQPCAQGNFELTLFDLETFTWMASMNKKRVPNLGDEAIDASGSTYVRVGDLAMTVVNNSGSDGLARLVLAAAAPRLR